MLSCLIRGLVGAALLLSGPAHALPPTVSPPPPVGAAGGIAGLDATAHVPADNLYHPVAIGRRAQFGGFLAANTTPGFRTGLTSRMWERTPTGPGIYAIRLVYSGYYSNTCSTSYVSNGTCEAPSPNPVTCAASLETNAPGLTTWNNGNGGTTLTPNLTFGGQTSFTLPSTGLVRSDWFYINLPGNSAYYVRTYCSDTIAGKIPIRAIGQLALLEGSNANWSSGLTFGTGDGSKTSFAYTVPVQYVPVAPGSIVFAISGQGNVTDNASGGCPASNGVASCTINYAAGTLTIVTTTAPANGVTINGSLTGGTGGGDATQTAAIVPFRSDASIFQNPVIGPVSVEGLQVPGTSPRLRAIGILGDSIDEGIGNYNGSLPITDTSWIDYSVGGRFGIVKAAVSAEQLGIWADPRGRFGRLAILSGVDRVIDDEATNELPNGKSLSQLISYFLQAQAGIVSILPHGGGDLWWVTMLPRTTTATSGVPTVPGTGPYTGAGAAYGSGPVSGGIRSATITGDGATMTFPIAMPGAPLLPGSLWGYGGGITVIDSGAGGTGSTTLSGTGIATGAINAATGAGSITFTAAPAAGQQINLYAYSSGASARNAWNHFLFNWAVPQKLLGGVIDTASCVEASPGSSTGTGSGQWIASSYTYDGTHPSALAHQSTIPSCIGPAGTIPSTVWAFQ